MKLTNVRLYDGVVYKDPTKKYSVTIEEGRIGEVIEGELPSKTGDVIDGMERVLSPAFHDSHMHFLRYGLMKRELDLRHVESWEEMKHEVHEYYPEMEEGDWVVGRGLNDSNFKDRQDLLTGKDLDELHLHTYMFFLHQDGHECVVNHKVLELLKEENEFKEIPDAFKETDDHGEWTGRFKDSAVHYIKHHFRGRSSDDAREAIKKGIPHMLKHGITTIHTDDLNFIGSYDRLWTAYSGLEKDGELPIRVYLHHYIFKKEHLQDFLERHPHRTGEGSDHVKVGAVKIFLDGTQRLHTSAMRIPYKDQPDTTGNLIYSQEELNELIRLASENRMQVAMHAIGDKAVEQAITALEQDEARTDTYHHRIIHAQTLGEDLLYSLGKIKPTIETQPSFLMGEWDQKEKWVGEDLAPYCDAFKSIINHDIPYTLSSDLPIGSIDPFEGMFAAVNRTDLSGRPEGGWQPQEKLTVNEAYRGYTSMPTLIELNEPHNSGYISAGERADFILLDRHPLEVASDDLNNIRVVETWHDGKKVYSV